MTKPPRCSHRTSTNAERNKGLQPPAPWCQSLPEWQSSPSRITHNRVFFAGKRGLPSQSDAESDAAGSSQETAGGRTGRWRACREHVASRRDRLPAFDAEGLETRRHVSGCGEARAARKTATVRDFLGPGTYGKKLCYRTSERSGANYGCRAASAGLFLCSARDGQAA